MDSDHTNPGKPETDDGQTLMDAIGALSEGIAVFDADRRLVTFNERYVEMLEPISEMIEPGLRWEDMLQGCVAGGVYASSSGRELEWQANVGGGKAREAEIVHSDGRIYTVRYNPTASGGFVLIRTDVTEDRHAAQRVRESETLLRTILDTNPAPVVMARLRDGLILYRSPAAKALFGDTTHTRQHYADPTERERFVQALRREGQVDDRRITFLSVDGTEIPMSTSGRLTHFGGETCVVSTLIDLRDGMARDTIIRKVVENCPAPILMTEARSGRVLFRGPEIDRLFGTDPNTNSFYVDAADRRAFLEALRKDGSVVDHKARFRGADGRTFWGAVSARLIEYEGKEVIVSYSRDMTHQLDLETDLSRQRERLFQNEKLTALGGLLANVAHALNNPLSVVIGHALMLREGTDDPDVIRQADRIGQAAERCAEVVKTYLTMTRQDPTELVPSDINEIVMTAVDVSRQGNRDTDIEIQCRLAPDLPEVSADPDQLAQLVINLLLNAEAAISETGRGSRIVVETARAPRTGCLRITVEDNGPGVPPDIAQKIFEPFFTTHGIGNGQGIGLTWCHRIAQTHNGQIRLDPDHTGGARFVLELPVEEETEETSDAAPDDSPARILVVDDEPDVADLNGEVLERVGYDVTVAHSGAEAVDALENRSFDCILSDLNMPDIDGRGLFDRIRRDHAELLARTGFVTGDTMGRASQAFLLESGRPYLEKPVSPSELRDFVAGILADGGPQ